MEIKLFDSELRVMEVLWREGDLSAGQIAKLLKGEIDWNRNTTYTVIKKCIDKGVLERYEPNFMCKATITKEQVQHAQTDELIDKLFDGSIEKFFSAFIGNKRLSKEEAHKLKKIVDKLK